MNGLAYGFACPACGGTKAEIEGYFRETSTKGYFMGMKLYCVRCEHRWYQAR